MPRSHAMRRLFLPAFVLLALVGGNAVSSMRWDRPDAALSVGGRAGAVGGESFVLDTAGFPRGAWRPAAAVAGDFDGDGVTDLAAVYSGDGKGIVVLHRGDPEFASSERRPDAKPFYRDVTILTVDLAPGFAVASDFDADGLADLVLGSRGSPSLAVLRGDARRGLVPGLSVPIDAPPTALAAADIDRADGLPDLMVAVGDESGYALLLFESTTDALVATPERVPLPEAATVLTTGAFHDRPLVDVAAAGGARVVLVSGRDRRLHTPGATADPVSAEAFAQSPDLSMGSDVFTRVRTRLGVRDATSPETGLEDSRQDEHGLALAEDEIGAAMRLDADGQDDLAILDGSTGQIRVVLTAPLAATFVVTSTADTPDVSPGDGICSDGSACTLRAAIQEANALAGADTINFSLGTGTPTIAPATALPSITGPVSIVGNTGGATRIQISGASAPAGVNGLTLEAGSSGSLIRSLVVNRFSGTGAGIRIQSGSNTVEDCWIGLDAAGSTSVGGNGGGILLTGAAATGNLIGGATASVRNVISHNTGAGIRIESTAAGNKVQGNYIGTNPGANVAAGNTGDGIAVASGAMNNEIGSTISTPGSAPGNVISANAGNGVSISDMGSGGNLIQGNLIGPNGAGASALGNGQNGVLIQLAAASNTVGGTTDSKRNVISGNSSAASDGVEINGAGTNTTNVLGNYIGLTAAGTAALSNGNNGVLVTTGPTGTVIGAATSTPGATGGKVISGNSKSGIYVDGAATSGTTIQGNLVGLRAGGAVAQANLNDGVAIVNATGTTIGGAAVTQRNILSGNTWRGIYDGAGPNTIVQGNYVGTDATGAAAVPNMIGGVTFGNASGGLPGALIGGATSTPGTPPGNVISGNAGSGIIVSGAGVSIPIQGNIIGLNATGQALSRIPTASCLHQEGRGIPSVERPPPSVTSSPGTATLASTTTWGAETPSRGTTSGPTSRARSPWEIVRA